MKSGSLYANKSPLFYNQNIIILTVLSKQYYNPESIRKGFDSITGIVCPGCLKAEHLVYHASYEKYYYDEHIVIVRLLCTQCGITHALIPSFSLPGTSIGTAEAERYLHTRAEGVSRMNAGMCFFRTRDERAVSGIFRKDDFAMRFQHENHSTSRRESLSCRIRIS